MSEYLKYCVWKDLLFLCLQTSPSAEIITAGTDLIFHVKEDENCVALTK